MPSFLIEQQYQGPVAGIDEAGRGPLAGPVVAACVHIPAELPFLADVRDSKKLSAQKREGLFTEITRNCAFGIAVAEAEEIDAINILQATFLAMGRAVDAMRMAFDVDVKTLLIDGNQRPRGLEGYEIHTVVKGDDKSYSIACASILAKVTRDRLMHELGARHPQYGFEKHMGYGTAAHMDAIAAHGPTIHHRKSFAPLKAQVQGG